MFATSKYTPSTAPSRVTGQFCNNEIGYRFRFNGQEQDNEIAGVGNILSAEYWEYDTRLGRRWNLDPIEYPWQSGYATFNNNPNYFNDPFGLEGERPSDKTYKQTEKSEDSSIDYIKPKDENKNPPSLLYRIINFFKEHQTGPKGKWVKDDKYTELPGTFNHHNNTFRFSASPEQSDKIISYKIINKPQVHNHFTNFSFWSLNGLIQNGNAQKTKTMKWGGHIPISPYFIFGEHLPSYSGIGGTVALIGATMMSLSSFEVVLGKTERYAMLMMTGAVMSHRINPAFRNFTNFEIKVYSNQSVNEGDFKMLVKYKRYVNYLDLTDNERGKIRRWYYGY